MNFKTLIILTILALASFSLAVERGSSEERMDSFEDKKREFEFEPRGPIGAGFMPVEDIVIGKVFEKISEKYNSPEEFFASKGVNEEKASELCSSNKGQERIVNLLLSDVGNIDTGAICSDFTERDFCNEEMKNCERIGQPMDLEDEENEEDAMQAERNKVYRPSCPFNEATFMEKCAELSKKEFEARAQERMQDARENCEEQYEESSEMLQDFCRPREQYRRPPEEYGRPEGPEHSMPPGDFIPPGDFRPPSDFRPPGEVIPPIQEGQRPLEPAPVQEPTPAPTPAPEPAPSPEPTPASSPEPTLAPSPEPTLVVTQANARVISFSSFKGPFGVEQSQCSDGRISKEVFVSSCVEEFNKHKPSGDEVARNCKRQVKRLQRESERVCKDIEKGKSRCVAEVQKACKFQQEATRKCQELSNPEKVKLAVFKMVRRECRTSLAHSSYRPVEEREIRNEREIPLLIATEDSSACEGALPLLGKVLGFQLINNMRIYEVVAAPGKIEDAKKLDCVLDAKVDQALIASRKVDRNELGIEQEIAAISVTRKTADKDTSNVLSIHEEKLSEVQEALKVLQEQETSKDFTYAVQKFFGLKAAQEQEEAKKLQSESDELAKAIESLKAITGQVTDPVLSASLAKQVEQLTERQKQLAQMASAKKKFSAGLLDVITKLGGLID